jgi:hypothetical protein
MGVFFPEERNHRLVSGAQVIQDACAGVAFLEAITLAHQLFAFQVLPVLVELEAEAAILEREKGIEVLLAFLAQQKKQLYKVSAGQWLGEGFRQAQDDLLAIKQLWIQHDATCPSEGKKVTLS